MNVCGAILAGGLAQRMGGGQKALVELGGLPLVEHVRRALAPVVDEVFLVAHDPEPLSHLGLRVVKDAFQIQCPLSGIQAALAGASAPVVFIVACDLPFLSPAFVQAVTARMHPEVDAVVPERDGWYLYPLAAAYSVRCLSVATAMLERQENQAVRIFEYVNTVRIPLHDLERSEPNMRSLTNINTREELDKAEKDLS